MKTGTREVLLNQYINATTPLRSFYDEIRNQRNQKKIRRRMAVNCLFSSDKKYNYNLFIGDSKTPVGNFSMTLREARVKNKGYETKLFNSTDDSYRLRTLRLTDESKLEFGKDMENKIQELAAIQLASKTNTPD